MQILHTNVYIRPVDWSLVKFPPDSEPPALPPPGNHPTLAHPFTIPEHIYKAFLAPHVPITVALVYATSVTALNRHNRKNGHKQWTLSKTRPFHLFVIAHNVLLALYSAWTFLGMLSAIKTSVPGPRGKEGLPGFVDALCKIHGPRGLGSAATFNATTEMWSIADSTLHLAAGGRPEETDVGRIWNEGLAFYGWLFYVSKFYEVIDTFIILAKGKRSSTLQKYHHAGAMMCMWAGIRYMAPPIWMFVFVNSAIHAMMYTYYTLSALGYRVPMVVKRTLTTLQIAQFVFGASFAFSHLFVAYKIPVSVPYIFSAADLTSIPSDMSRTASSAIATASAGIGAWLKKVALRAAGSEGLAENVENEQGETFGIDAVHAARDLKNREELRFRDELRTIHCTDTSGQVFAILFNCFYLTPLTALFVRFFIKSYINRARRHSTSTTHVAKQAHDDASKGFQRIVTGERAFVKGESESAAKSSEDVKRKLVQLEEKIESAKEDVESTLQDLKDKQSVLDNAKDNL